MPVGPGVRAGPLPKGGEICLHSGQGYVCKAASMLCLHDASCVCLCVIRIKVRAALDTTLRVKPN